MTRSMMMKHTNAENKKTPISLLEKPHPTLDRSTGLSIAAASGPRLLDYKSAGAMTKLSGSMGPQPSRVKGATLPDTHAADFDPVAPVLPAPAPAPATTAALVPAAAVDPAAGHLATNALKGGQAAVSHFQRLEKKSWAASLNDDNDEDDSKDDSE